MKRHRCLIAGALAVAIAAGSAGCADEPTPTPSPDTTNQELLLVLDDRKYDDLDAVDDIGWEGSFETHKGCVAFKETDGTLRVPVFATGVTVEDFDPVDQSFTLDFAGYGTLRSSVAARGYVAHPQDVSVFENGEHCLEAIDPDNPVPVYIVTLGEDIPWWPSDSADE